MESLQKCYEEIESLKKEIQSLESTILLERAKNNEIITQQSKMAAMGEMLANIAHQWRQPLMELSSILIATEAKVRIENQISNEEILETIEKSNEVMKYMSNTIDDFKNFFAKDKEKITFKISKQISGALHIINSVLFHQHIKLDIIIKDNPSIYGFANEYSQVLINLISNAKDIIVARGIENGKIEVKVYTEGSLCITQVKDNGGGITIEPIDKIFEPFFTAEKKDGSGIGLFMSKLIIENNMHGSLSVKNDSEGAIFSIIFPTADN
jgi:signal transduction histidine kinase